MTEFAHRAAIVVGPIYDLIQMPVRRPTSSLGLGYHFLLFYRTHSYNYVCTGYSRPCHTELKHEAFSENVILVGLWPTCRTPAVGGLIVCEWVSLWVCVSEDMSPYCSAHDEWLIMKLCMYVGYHDANNVSNVCGDRVTQFIFLNVLKNLICQYAKCWISWENDWKNMFWWWPSDPIKFSFVQYHQMAIPA